MYFAGVPDEMQNTEALISGIISIDRRGNRSIITMKSLSGCLVSMAAADKAMCQEPLAARGGPAASSSSPPSPHTTLSHRLRSDGYASEFALDLPQQNF